MAGYIRTGWKWPWTRKQHREYGRRWYQRKGKEKERKKRVASREWLWARKKAKCRDCRRKYHPAAMQFDHVRGKKLFEVNVAAVGHYARSRILRELAKCELVCANCHAIRTWERRTIK